MRRPIAAVALAGLLGLAVAACGDDDSSSATTTASSTAPSGTVAVTGAWARTSAGVTDAGAAYLTVTSSADDALTGVTVPADVAATAELHETTMVDMGSASTTTTGGASTSVAVMTMKRVDKIDLPAGKAVELKPGGYHVMLMKLAKPLAKGQTFDLTLRFAKAAPKTVKVEVRDNA